MSDTTTPKRILYIEDDQEMIDLVSLILRKGGYQITGALGGKVGLEILTQETPDLILLDLMMPDMDGWEFYQRLRADEKNANIPVIIITAKAQPIDRVLGLHIAKVNDYLSKPFRPQDLLDSIAKTLNNQAN